jgi:hypothetical protein
MGEGFSGVTGENVLKGDDDAAFFERGAFELGGGLTGDAEFAGNLFLC